MQCKERARVETGAEKPKRKGNRSTFAHAGVAIATEEALTPVLHDTRESETSRKATRQVAG